VQVEIEGITKDVAAVKAAIQAFAADLVGCFLLLSSSFILFFFFSCC